MWSRKNGENIDSRNEGVKKTERREDRKERKGIKKKNNKKQEQDVKNDDDDEDTATLGVSAVLYNHGFLYPDSVWGSSGLHRSTNKSDASTSSMRSNQTS